MDFACKECHLILEDKSCPRCPDSEVSREWQGFIEVLNPEKFLNAKIGTLISGLPGEARLSFFPILSFSFPILSFFHYILSFFPI